jgi:hypothetical protein
MHLYSFLDKAAQETDAYVSKRWEGEEEQDCIVSG